MRLLGTVRYIRNSAFVRDMCALLETVRWLGTVRSIRNSAFVRDSVLY